MVNHIILIDDDPVNNFLNKEIILTCTDTVNIVAFEQPEEALNYFKHTFFPPKDAPGVVFLDINMPMMNGWQVLEALENDCPALLSDISIYILTSSIDTRDIERAESNMHVKKLMNKPIDESELKLILDN